MAGMYEGGKSVQGVVYVGGSYQEAHGRETS